MSGTGGNDPVDRARRAFSIFTTAPAHCFKQCVTSIFSSGQPSARLGDVMPGFPQALLLETPSSPWPLWGTAMGCGKWALSEGSSPLGALRWPLMLSPPAARAVQNVLPALSMGISACSHWVSLRSSAVTHSGRQGWGSTPAASASLLLSNRASHKAQLSYDSFYKWINNQILHSQLAEKWWVLTWIFQKCKCPSSIKQILLPSSL